MTYLKKAIITGAYIEVLLLILWILFSNNWIYRTVKSGSSEVFSGYGRMLQHLFGTMFVTNGILLIVLIIAAFIIDTIIKTKNNE